MGTQVIGNYYYEHTIKRIDVGHARAYCYEIMRTPILNINKHLVIAAHAGTTSIPEQIGPVDDALLSDALLLPGLFQIRADISLDIEKRQQHACAGGFDSWEQAWGTLQETMRELQIEQNTDSESEER